MLYFKLKGGRFYGRLMRYKSNLLIFNLIVMTVEQKHYH